VATIFAFDAATATASCALLRDGEVVAERVAPARRLLETVADVLGDAGVAMREIDALVVGTGPGSFTGVRIALATARGLCAALDLPAAGVSTLEAFAGGRVVIDARRGEVFSAGPLVGRPDELDVAGVRLIGDGAIRYRTVFEAAGAEVPPDDDPVHLPSAARLVGHAGAFGDVCLIDPLYLRLPDAVATR
jgi:tRNA threonylcarbamoyl adenosine modification protein YeaZ